MGTWLITKKPIAGYSDGGQGALGVSVLYTGQVDETRGSIRKELGIAPVSLYQHLSLYRPHVSEILLWGCLTQPNKQLIYSSNKKL